MRVLGAGGDFGGLHRGCWWATGRGNCYSQNCSICSEQERKQLANSVKRGLS